MMSFSQEMLRFLQPELLQPKEMIDVLTKRGVHLSQLKHLDQPTLLDIFRNTAVPKPQRKKRDPRSCNSSSPTKIKNRIVVTSENDRRSASDSRTERRHSSSDHHEKYRTTGSDRLKPPPDFPKFRDYSSSDRSQNSSRLKPPPDLSQPESKKIKLNRSSCENLDNIIIKDRSKRDSSSDSSFIIKSSLTNGGNERSISEEVRFFNSSEKKVSLKRNFESSQSSDSPPKKRQPITWP